MFRRSAGSINNTLRADITAEVRACVAGNRGVPGGLRGGSGDVNAIRHVTDRRKPVYRTGTLLDNLMVIGATLLGCRRSGSFATWMPSRLSLSSQPGEKSTSGAMS